MWRIREFRRSILNLWRFRKVVWNFNSFEYEGTVAILQQSLIEQGRYMRKYGYHDCDKESLATIAVAIHFCDKVLDGELVEKVIYCDKLGQVISKEMSNWWI